MCHFDSSGSDTSNNVKQTPRRGAVLNIYRYKLNIHCLIIVLSNNIEHYILLDILDIVVIGFVLIKRIQLYSGQS